MRAAAGAEAGSGGKMRGAVTGKAQQGGAGHEAARHSAAQHPV